MKHCYTFHWHHFPNLFVLVLLLAFRGISLAQSGCNEKAQHAFERQHWEEVEVLLTDQRADYCDQRLYALARYHTQDFEAALAEVQSLLTAFPGDQELNRAALVMLTALNRTEEARQRATRLDSLGDSDFANLYLARLKLLEGDPYSAESILRPLLDAPNAGLAQEAGQDLIVVLQRTGRYREIPPVAARALARDPESFSAYRFGQYTLENQRRLHALDISLGYRLDYDDNVSLLPNEQGPQFGNSDKEDFRHVLFADVFYRRMLKEHLNLYAEGHFSHSLHQEFSEFDFTRVNLVGGLGGSYARWGWRVPAEYTHDRFDGSAFRDTFAVTPGAYVAITGGLESHFYFRYRSEEYERSVSLSEDRSGEGVGGGLLLVGPIGERWFVRVYGEVEDVDTDGSNWDRKEWRMHAQAEFSPTPNWTITAGYRYQEADFDQIHDVFLGQRKDEANTAFASLNYRFSQPWEIRAQVTFLDQQSTLQIYDFERTVLSLGISRDF